jgi:uncharacterized protein with PQ loop repeat
MEQLRSQLNAAEEHNIQITREYNRLFKEKEKELTDVKQKMALLDTLPVCICHFIPFLLPFLLLYQAR